LLVFFEKSDALFINIPTAIEITVILGKRLPHFLVLNQHRETIPIGDPFELLL